MKRAVLLLLCLYSTLTLAAPARLITLGGDVTEIVFALGAGDQVIARDSTSTAPAAVNALPDVGYLRQLSAEGILSLQPTLILASEQAGPPAVLRQLRQQGVRVVTVPGQAERDVISQKIALIAQALQREPAGRALQARIEQQLRRLPPQPLPLKALFILNHSGMQAMGAGAGTAADAALRLAGLQNALYEMKRYQPLSAEGVIAHAPDIVVITTSGMQALGSAEKLWALPGLALTPAGRQRRVIVVDEMALLGFGLRTPAAIMQLRKTAETRPAAP